MCLCKHIVAFPVPAIKDAMKQKTEAPSCAETAAGFPGSVPGFPGSRLAAERVGAAVSFLGSCSSNRGGRSHRGCWGEGAGLGHKLAVVHCIWVF